MIADKIYITDAFYWRKEDFDKNIASKTKVRPVVYCVHGHVVSDAKYSRECRGCRDEFKKMVNVVAEKLWRNEKKNIFIEMANNVHNNKYTYPDFKFVNNQTPGNITCPLHGNFPQAPNNHLRGAGCPICGEQSRADKRRSTLDKFIQAANVVHDSRYTYPDFKYVDSKTPGDITCPEHGNFPQTPNNHLSGAGCPICGSQASADAHRKDLETFILQANEVHDNKYTYPDFKYVDTKTPGDITCPWHGNFPQTPNNHLAGHGCPMCKNKTEGVVFTFLKEVLEPLGLKVEHMGKRDSKGVGSMDIRITKGHMTIYVEVDGEQHFKDVKNWKSKAKDAQASDLKKHIRATAKGHVIVRIDQVWVWESHLANKTEWSSRLRQTIVKLVSGVEPSIDELFLSNKPDKYFNHPCYQQVKINALEK